MATIKSYTDKPKRKSYFKHNVVYCKKGDIVITYPNVLAAEEATGIYSDRIYKCCNGKKISAGGFSWSYTPFEEYPDDGRIWKDVEGYENLYQVSNDGLVRTSHKGLWEILSAGKTKHGYYNVLLHKDGKRKNERVHRLVAKAFIPNPDNLPQVNHKDECKTNNRVDNLEWCTAKYNNNYGTYIERQRNFSPRNTPVLMFDLNGNFEKEFISTREAAREMNTSHALICHCCDGYGDKQNRVSLKGKLWCYKGEEDTIPSKVEFVRNYKYRTKVVVCFPDGTSKEFESATKAGKEIKVCRNKLNKDGYDVKSGLRWTVD